jgi:hypothetical protein
MSFCGSIETTAAADLRRPIFLIFFSTDRRQGGALPRRGRGRRLPDGRQPTPGYPSRALWASVPWPIGHIDQRDPIELPGDSGALETVWEKAVRQR